MTYSKQYWKKHRACVGAVRDRQGTAVNGYNAYAVCHKSLQKGKHGRTYKTKRDPIYSRRTIRGRKRTLYKGPRGGIYYWITVPGRTRSSRKRRRIYI